MFAKVHTNISNANGIGLTSGQQYQAVAASLTMCSIPAGPINSGEVVLELTSAFRLIPTGPGARRKSTLLLIPQITFGPSGTLNQVAVGVSPIRVPTTPISAP
jgi:hypothetical protein